MREFLVRHRDLPKAVATNAEPPNVEVVLHEAGLRPSSVSHRRPQVPNPKPHPEVYLRAAGFLGIPTHQCVVFEDSHGGVAAALAAGMRVIGITTTYSDLPGASLLARDFNDPAIKKWLRAGE